MAKNRPRKNKVDESTSNDNEARRPKVEKTTRPSRRVRKLIREGLGSESARTLKPLSGGSVSPTSRHSSAKDHAFVREDRDTGIAMNNETGKTFEVKKDSLKKDVRSLLQPPRCRGSSPSGFTEASIMRRWNSGFLKEIRTLVEVVATEQVSRQLHEIKTLLEEVKRASVVRVSPDDQVWRRYADGAEQSVIDESVAAFIKAVK